MSADYILERTETELEPYIEIGLEEENLKQKQNKILYDILDIHFARIEQLINNVHYKPQQIKSFYLLNDNSSKPTKQLSDKERAIDAELKAKALKALTDTRNAGINTLFSL